MRGAGQGRPPTPPQIRIAKGTHRDDRHGSKAAIGAEKLLDSVPKVPSGKGEAFKRWWKHYASEMLAAGTLTARDVAPLEMLCDAHQLLADAQVKHDDAERNGELYMPTITGAIAKHPVFQVIAQASKTIAMYQINMGFTPTGRSKVPPANVQSQRNSVSGMNRKG